MKDNKIRPITIEIEKEIWEKFKKIVPRTKTLNYAVTELIKREVRKNG